MSKIPKAHIVIVLLLSIFSFGLLITGFSIVGTPISQKDIRLDNQRLSDFSNIRYSVEEYYRQQHTVPDSLSDIKTSSYSGNKLPADYKDPESGKPYEYKKTASYTYQFCTKFSTDSERAKKQSGYSYYYDTSEVNNKHKKGYDCVTYNIPTYVRTDTLYKPLTNPTITKVPLSTNTPAPKSTATPTPTKNNFGDGGDI